MKKIYTFLRDSAFLNRRNKKTIIFATFVFLIVSVLVFTIAIVPQSLAALANNPAYQPTRNYKAVEELADYPANQVTMKNRFAMSTADFIKFSAAGLNSTDASPNPNGLRFSRGIEAINLNDEAKIKQMLPLYNEYGLKEHNHGNYNRWQDFLNYYEHYSNKVPQMTPDNFVSSMSFGALFGMGEEYLGGTVMNEAFFHAINDYSEENSAAISPFTPIFGLEAGLKYKKENNKYVFLGGPNSDVPITTLGEIFAQAIYQQLPYYQKSLFFSNKFTTLYDSVPINKGDSKFTYLQGHIMNNSISDYQNDVQVWGLNNNTANGLKLNNSSFNQIFNMDDNHYLTTLYGIKNHDTTTAIPCAINKNLQRKYNLHPGDVFTYHNNVPLIEYKEHVDSDNEPVTSSPWKIADPHGFYFKTYPGLPTKNPVINSGFFYHNMVQKNDKESGDTNSVSYLNQANYEKNSWKYNRLKAVDNALGNESNYQYKVVDVANNDFNKPLIYINQLFANYLHGYTKGNSLATLLNQDPTATDFNGILTQKLSLNYAICYSDIGDYSEIGLDGSPLAWNDSEKAFIRKAGSMIADSGPIVWGYDHHAKLLPHLGNNEKDHTTNPSSDKDSWAFQTSEIAGIRYGFDMHSFNVEVGNIEGMSNQILSLLFVALSVIAIIMLILLLRILVFRYMRYIGVFKSFGYSNRQIFFKLFAIYSGIALGCFIVAIPLSYFISLGILSALTNQMGFQITLITLNLETFLSALASLLFLYFIVFAFTFYYLFKIDPLKAFQKSQ